MSIEHFILGIGGAAFLYLAVLVAVSAWCCPDGGVFGESKQLANEANPNGLVGISNELTEADWIQLTPLGDFPHARGLQRVSKGSVEKMANHFNGMLSSAKRALFGGVPFYVGHPDVPGLANEYPDKRAFGWIKALEARADGLYGQVEWSEPGKAMLANKHYKFFSPYWDAKEIGSERGRVVYEPVTLLSVGLTNQPNLPVKPLANAKDEAMTKEQRDALCQQLKLANTATDQEINAAASAIIARAETVTALANDKTTAESALGTEKSEHGKTKTTLANAVKERNKLALDNAIDKGRIKPAERADWETKLTEDFSKYSVELANQQSGVKTAATAGIGARRNVTMANTEREAAEKVQSLIQKEMQETKCNYETAYNRVRMANAALFEQAD